ncbi:MAG TPA: hypothetical protein VJ302_07815 [Blastocatellia bacterium]|nr:hypothetical protein [Blastocatellia bacterium]
MIGQPSGSKTKEHIWLIALYEHEIHADELLMRLNAIGIDTSEATTVRVEIDDQMRAAKYTQLPQVPPLSPLTRSAVTGAVLGGAALLCLGIVSYASGVAALQFADGLFNHVIFCVMMGSALGTAFGAVLSLARGRKINQTPLPAIEQLRSEGFLVAVKMPPPLAEQAEEIARGLGAKEILL